LHFLVFFLPLLTFENEKSAVRFWMWNVENEQFRFRASAGWFQDFN
jgi:hypothetical protein